MKPGERELSLGQSIDFSGSAGHAHGLMEALGGKLPLALLHLPSATQTVEVSHGLAVLAFGCQSLGSRKMLFPQISLPKLRQSV